MQLKPFHFTKSNGALLINIALGEIRILIKKQKMINIALAIFTRCTKCQIHSDKAK